MLGLLGVLCLVVIGTPFRTLAAEDPERIQTQTHENQMKTDNPTNTTPSLEDLAWDPCRYSPNSMACAVDSTVFGGGESDDSTSPAEARTYKMNKKMVIPLLVGILLKVASFVPLILGKLSLLALISIAASKLALVISAIIATKKLYAGYDMWEHGQSDSLGGYGHSGYGGAVYRRAQPHPYLPHSRSLSEFGVAEDNSTVEVTNASNGASSSDSAQSAGPSSSDVSRPPTPQRAPTTADRKTPSSWKSMPRSNEVGAQRRYRRNAEDGRLKTAEGFVNGLAAFGSNGIFAQSE